jgi:hypothetical protein
MKKGVAGSFRGAFSYSSSYPARVPGILHIPTG